MPFEILKLILSGVFGGIVVAILNNRLAAKREKTRDADARRRRFLGFVERAISEIQNISHHADSHGKLWDHYVLIRPGLRQEAALVSGDFAPLEEFSRLCDQAAAMQYGDVFDSSRVARDVIIEPFYRLREYINAQTK